MNIQLVQIYETEANWIYWLYIYKPGYCVFEHIGLLVTLQKSYLFHTRLDGNFIYNSRTFLNIFESVLCGFHSMREWGAAQNDKWSQQSKCCLALRQGLHVWISGETQREGYLSLFLCFPLFSHSFSMIYLFWGVLQCRLNKKWTHFRNDKFLPRGTMPSNHLSFTLACH